MIETVEVPTSFLREVEEVPGGEDVQNCIQCGRCSASCPNAAFMDHTPRKLIQMIRSGMREEVLSSNTMWLCLSCYTCTVRCPRGVKITDLMHALEGLSVKHGMTNGGRTPAMYRSFSDFVYSVGTVPEVGFMTWYYLLTNPLRAVKMLPAFWKLLRRGRVSIKARRLSPEGEKQLRAILDKADSLGGA